MTNADRIRQMNDEELAQFMWNASIGREWKAQHDCRTCMDDTCVECQYEWLKLESNTK